MGALLKAVLMEKSVWLIAAGIVIGLMAGGVPMYIKSGNTELMLGNHQKLVGVMANKLAECK